MCSSLFNLEASTSMAGNSSATIRTSANAQCEIATKPARIAKAFIADFLKGTIGGRPASAAARLESAGGGEYFHALEPANFALPEDGPPPLLLSSSTPFVIS